jgi:hypothetical protein
VSAGEASRDRRRILIDCSTQSCEQLRRQAPAAGDWRRAGAATVADNTAQSALVRQSRTGFIEVSLLGDSLASSLIWNRVVESSAERVRDAAINTQLAACGRGLAHTLVDALRSMAAASLRYVSWRTREASDSHTTGSGVILARAVVAQVLS